MNKNKALFLDRDGVLNKNRDDYVKSIDELEIFSNIISPLKKLQKDFLLLVITNQSAINRGLTTHQKINDIHDTIENYLVKHDVFIKKFYYCPHRPDENCVCRKPKSGLLDIAIKEFNIEPKLSWLIGDNDSDIEAGKSVGCSTIKIDNNTTLEFAVEKILQLTSLNSEKGQNTC